MKIAEKFRLDNKVAIITGASKGIGKAIALALGQQGAKVVISSRKQEAVDEVVEEFKKVKIEAYGIAAHMGDLEQIRNLVDVTNAHYGGIDIIVNNAAINPVFWQHSWWPIPRRYLKAFGFPEEGNILLKNRIEVKFDNQRDWMV